MVNILNTRISLVTLTRPGGWFDLLVNGGGAVTLQFQRSPFKPLTRTSYIPWNEIFVMDPVVMASNGGAGISWEEEESSTHQGYSAPCPAHDHDTMRPVLLTSYSGDRSVPRRPEELTMARVAMVDSGTLVTSVNVPGTEVSLVYDSSAASSALATLTMVLTPDTIPESLYRVHVKITVAGLVIKKLLEAEEGLVYKYSWNKRNVYNQKVFGSASVRVSVGFQYRECGSIVWDTRTARLGGYPVDITNIGGWNLNIHHHFNPFQGRIKVITL